MVSELKPRPFCGTDDAAAATIFTSTISNPHRLMCGACGAFAPSAKTAEQAIAAWNTRARPKDDEVERVKKALVLEVSRQTNGRWPSGEGDILLIDDVLDFDDIARAAIAAMDRGEG